MSYSRVQAIERGRCVLCGLLTDAYICESCAGGPRLRYDEYRSPTATRVGRSQQQRVEVAAAYEQMSTLWSVVEFGVLPSGRRGTSAQRGDAKREERMRVLRADKCRRGDGSIHFHPMKVDDLPEKMRKRRELRKWVRRMARVLDRIAWAALDEMTRPA